ncbi:MAG: hypothetical protein ABID87_09660 [Chloroflexota bacterium]
MDYEKISAKYSELKPGLNNLKLSRVLSEQVRRLDKLIEQNSVHPEVLITVLGELHSNIIHEYTSPYFIQINVERRELYEQRAPLFGSDVANTFPSASADIAGAGRCLALDEWTACVFHLMRVLEIGLRDLTSRIGLEKRAIELENWKTIIDQIEKKIRQLEQAPRSDEKSEILRFYSEAANCFRYFKDAWRNHVSHSHAHYSERDAFSVYVNVQSFMQTLAHKASFK